MEDNDYKGDLSGQPLRRPLKAYSIYQATMI